MILRYLVGCHGNLHGYLVLIDLNVLIDLGPKKHMTNY